MNAPDDLGMAGRDYFDRVTADYDLGVDSLALLVEVAYLIDRLAALRADVAARGVMVSGRVNPAVAESRQSVLALGRMIAQMGLPPLDGDSTASVVKSPTSIRASHAARARWSGAEGRHHRKDGTA